MSGNPEAYEQAMNAGHNAAWDHEWDVAIQAYGNAIQEFPEDPEAHIHLGLALFEVGRLDDALKIYTRAHQLVPNDPIPLEKSADVLERMGRLRDAAQQYINVAEIYFSQRDIDKAISNWERSTHLTPGLVAIHAKLAQVRERIGDKKGAIREYLALAFNFQRQGDSDRAMKAAQRAYKLDRNDPQIMNTLRAIEAGSPIAPPDDILLPETTSVEDDAFFSAEAVEVGDADPLGPMGEAMQDALGILAMYVMEEGGLDVAGSDALQGMELQRQGLNEEAVEAYLRAKSHLEHPALMLNLGALLVLVNRPQEAIEYLSAGSRHPALAAGAYHGLGQAYYQLEEYKEATRYFIESLREVDTGLVINPDDARGLTALYDRILQSLARSTDEALANANLRFMNMLQGKDWKQRISETRRQIDETMRDQGEQGAVDILSDIRGDKLSESVALIDRYIRQGLYILAMDEAHQAVEFSPHYLPIHIRMAEIMIREGRVRNAISKYNTVAKTYIVRGEHDRAASILSEVLEMAPLDISVRENLIELLEAEERWDEAIDQYIDLADTYHQLGNFEQARDTFGLAERVALRMNAPTEKLVSIKHRMADVDQMRMDTRRAQRVYEEIIELSNEDERAYRMLVDINYRQGNQIEGIRRLDQLLSLFARKKQVSKILQMLEELVGLYANDTGLRSRLAAIYRQLGRNDQAIEHLRRLANLQLEAGLHKDAVTTLRQIVSLDPDGSEEVKRLLVQLGG